MIVSLFSLVLLSAAVAAQSCGDQRSCGACVAQSACRWNLDERECVRKLIPIGPFPSKSILPSATIGPVRPTIDQTIVVPTTNSPIRSIPGTISGTIATIRPLPGTIGTIDKSLINPTLVQPTFSVPKQTL